MELKDFLELEPEQQITFNFKNMMEDYYRRYEKKEREPDASVLVQIADFYDVSLDYLVGRSEKRER